MAGRAAQASSFEVPEDIVNVTDKMICRAPTEESCLLSEFVDIDTSADPEYLV